MTVDGNSTAWRYGSPMWDDCDAFQAGGDSRTALYCRDFRKVVELAGRAASRTLVVRS